ncbi:hypothetical protein K469DRAFT_699059 [Zopfia rhizophila CBS 207.26]|uniref:Uncharacterized protein n=1 Tax=Zopfia rhizophila CBS 207.26 TaxID=1314779 RepID=A0A6A6EW80_9PEZI|nr:hypothetical protein K469DRAFT_699059 [Zopfia rhizophila CBS 207.26]
MSSLAIEARSLSSLTTLASNPPSYPRNPTHVKHEPLVLYIARVPGSRDVFLSPMKPRDKVVTAEDVQSCLYYLHVDQPEDARLITPNQPLENVDDSRSTGTTPRQPPPPPVHRKAVPTPSPPYPLHSPIPGPPVPAHLMPSSTPGAPKRKPVPGMLTPRNNDENRHNIGAANFPQSFPALLDPNYNERRSFDSIQHRKENDTPMLPLRRLSGQRPNGNSASYHGRAPFDHPSKGTAFRDPFATHLEPPKYSPSVPPRSLRQQENPFIAGTSLTLIRRDPASNAQWNIARIEDPPVPDVSSFSVNDPSAAQKKKTGAPVYIEITNPGYSKFLNNSEGVPSLSTGTSDLSTRSQNLTVPDETASRNRPTEEPESVFRRRLWMEGLRYPNAGFGHRKINSRDSSMGRESPRSSFEGRERLSSQLDSPPTPSFLTRDDQTYSTIQVSNNNSGFRGYVFMSPWNGRCEFVTGGGGGTLKCRHVISGLQRTTAIAMPVSELRFNLPSSSKASTLRGKEPKKSSFFHRPRNSRNNSAMSDVRSDGTEEVRNSLDRLDLSLGQEFAGGGFGGKQAKLGKLIIEDEGLKMVDLLVAANLALWWRAYEKVDGRPRSNHGSFQA